MQLGMKIRQMVMTKYNKIGEPAFPFPDRLLRMFEYVIIPR